MVECLSKFSTYGQMITININRVFVCSSKIEIAFQYKFFGEESFSVGESPSFCPFLKINEIQNVISTSRLWCVATRNVNAMHRKRTTFSDIFSSFYKDDLYKLLYVLYAYEKIKYAKKT